MTIFRLPASHRRNTSRRSHIRFSRFALALVTLVSATGAQAFITVGPHGLHPTIQEGIEHAIANGGDEVRVELWLHNNPNGTSTVVPFVENISYDPVGNLEPPASVSVSGGWHADFQSQYTLPGGGIQGSWVKGAGADAPIFKIFAVGSAIISIRNFDFDGNNNTAGSATRGVVAGAQGSSFIVIADNFIHGVNLATSVSHPNSGGAGMAVQAADAANIYIAGNTIQSNKSVGTDNQSTYAGGAFVSAIGGGHVDFVLNTVTNNFASNSNGGGCRGGGVWAAALDTSSMELRGNTYAGNAQIFCSNGATGDAAEIEATNTAEIHVYDEIWTNNNVASNPGVYQVYMQADVSSKILAANGLITHSTWGGLFANSIAAGTIDISNYTVTGNPAIGITAIGGATQVWNTLAWDNSTDFDPRNGAFFANSLGGVDPQFVDAANGNYRLSATSPAIDAGSNAPTGGLRAFDLAFQSRPVNGTADIGAYEFQGNSNDRVFRDGFD